jgi:hypothetical protein
MLPKTVIVCSILFLSIQAITRLVATSVIKAVVEDAGFDDKNRYPNESRKQVPA